MEYNTIRPNRFVFKLKSKYKFPEYMVVSVVNDNKNNELTVTIIGVEDILSDNNKFFIDNEIGNDDYYLDNCIIKILDCCGDEIITEEYTNVYYINNSFRRISELNYNLNNSLVYYELKFRYGNVRYYNSSDVGM